MNRDTQENRVLDHPDDGPMSAWMQDGQWRTVVRHYLAYLSLGQPHPDPPPVGLREDARKPGGPDGIIRIFRSRKLRDEYAAGGVHETRHPGGTWYRAVSALSLDDALEFLGDCNPADDRGKSGSAESETAPGASLDGCGVRNCRHHLRSGQPIMLGPPDPWAPRRVDQRVDQPVDPGTT